MKETEDEKITAIAASERRGCIVAAAGCGKTEQIARATALSRHRRLILTHTHAGVESLRRRLKSLGVDEGKFQLETIAGWSLRFAAAFPKTSGLQEPLPLPGAWDSIYESAGRLLRSRGISRVIEASYDGLFVDEYQDCTYLQHEVVCGLAETLPTCIFGDPLQGIFSFRGQAPVDWQAQVLRDFPERGRLEVPWRWKRAGNEDLALWLAGVRSCLEAGKPVVLTELPDCVLPLALPALSKTNSKGNERHKTISNVCRSKSKSKSETLIVIGDATSESTRAKLAHSLAKLGFSCIDAIDSKDLARLTEGIERAAEQSKWEKLLDAAKECLSRAPIEPLKAAVRSHQVGGKKGAKRLGDLIPLALLASATGSPEALLRLLQAVQQREGVHPFRRDILFLLEYDLALQVTGVHPSLAEAVWAAKNQRRHAGRVVARRSIGSTLLVKGLEFDHAVIIDADRLDCKNLYVALTRAAKSITILSSSDVLRPGSSASSASNQQPAALQMQIPFTVKE